MLEVEQEDLSGKEEEKATKEEEAKEEEEAFFCTINKEEVPPVPSQNFLMRNAEAARTNADDRRRADGFRAKDAAGRKVKGRGAMVNAI